ncbi:peptidyl-tRNA hydrolase, chloroplastic-like [Corylus avellana]|uniref:peptidyl-tRNA hydrolase, chloroplastic-like n=1 Tax=Corylus avellana TaxID=13451 RepID=UPI00286A1C1D|nr:peptidyl-tRNA hydrolase, chloroplastic-like [Corylus avellana]
MGMPRKVGMAMGLQKLTAPLKQETLPTSSLSLPRPRFLQKVVFSHSFGVLFNEVSWSYVVFTYDGIIQWNSLQVGFEMVDAIAEAEGISISSVSFKALLGKGFIGDIPVMLAKPQTFMNASGESVGAIVSYYKIPLKQVIVIFDDLDLPFAKLRLLPKGGHGGHNGMRNIIDHFKGNRDFSRLRIGIGRPPGKMDPINFVLRPFTKQERQELDFTFQHGLEAVRILLLEGFNKSATFVNSAKPLEQLG